MFSYEPNPPGALLGSSPSVYNLRPLLDASSGVKKGLDMLKVLADVVGDSWLSRGIYNYEGMVCVACDWCKCG